ncbi:hypothetical protein SLW70_13225 [Flavobacterium sp. NG2]|uniref:hypothetical protein n=1 Tax=Flavobacterium sp. NG2 TaxID=3097547 RepID=UPI002A8410B6|nr:hypothetical protein [Flavobacterium sp. NG2]WPR70885.1 hypothetical protein SLW70_13225 [Flavobacterium sp. NG2]
MKKIGIYCVMVVFIGFTSCKNEEKEKAKMEAKLPVSVECYQALYENDTIDLTINTLKDEKITGTMLMKFSEEPNNDGEFSGEFHGDTLYADYSFMHDKNDKEMFKNPIAILKKGDTLILGNGKIEVYLGKSYFDKKSPIDFDNVKYKFTKVDCGQ